ncbi:MAG: flavodoxin-dependent (E)-4-hydroxy-3-methylbut-2-enyl-diphosphate synthase [Candidatus Eisenbacteria bacterium]
MHLRESYVRKSTRTVYVGDVPVGGGSPIAIESMTKTDTRDVRATVREIKKLEKTGCDLVRVAVPDYEAAEALVPIKQKTKMPIIADIHFNYKLALMALEADIDCVRINPGNIGGRENIIRTAEAARRQKVPLRIGVNAGSLEKSLLQKYGAPIPEALVESISKSVSLLEDIGFTDLILSAKASRVPVNIETYRMIANRFRYPLHVGVTEAGPPPSGTIRSAVGIGTLLAEGIGDTIRVSLTAPVEDEVEVGMEILKSLFLRESGPMIISCPTCGRCEVDLMRLVKQVEKKLAGETQPTVVAIMGCVVNGPGEAREADVGIAVGKGTALIFRKGEIVKKVAPSKAVNALFREMKQVVKRRGKPRRR